MISTIDGLPDFYELTATKCQRCRNPMPGTRRKAQIETMVHDGNGWRPWKGEGWVWTIREHEPCQCGWRFGDPRNGSRTPHPYEPDEANQTSPCRVCGDRQRARIHSAWSLERDSIDPRRTRSIKKLRDSF